MPDPNFRSIPRPSADTPRHTHADRAVDLPAAGYKREEVLKERADNLAEKAEVRASQMESHAIDPKALVPDREILAQFDGTNVTNAQPGFVYCWVNYDTPSSARGIMVKHKLAMQDRTGKPYGWQVVTGDLPESMENKDAAGYRRIGDTILMRISKENHQRLMRDEEQRLVSQLGSSHSNLKELGEKYRNKGVIVHAGENMDPRILKTMEAGARGAMAAEQRFDQGLREGTLNV